MKSKGMVLLLAGLLVLGLVGASWSGPPPKPPCGTNGPLKVTPPNPPGTSFVQGTTHTASATFTVTSPEVQKTGNCDSQLNPVFGNGGSSGDCDSDGNGANDITFTVSVSQVTPKSGITLTDDQKTKLKEAFFFVYDNCLTNPGSGSETVTLNFDNANVKDLPVGSYDVSIDVKPEEGVGVGAATVTFTVTITQPTAVDTQAPDVQIVSPASASKFLLNQPIPVEFTATDPLENGAGTGVDAVRAFISACSGGFNVDLTPLAVVTPSLPVAADVTVTATANITAAWIGDFTLTAEADDPAGHTGSAATSFSVGVNVAPLPPIAVPGRQFKVGSTVPIKWQVTGYEGHFLPPFENIKITISGPGGTTEERFAGDGAANIRWELDDSGKATQYITNYQIPAMGTYTVTVSVPSACGGESYVEQGSFTFTASTKGGKY
jgi:hypothetical protein